MVLVDVALVGDFRFPGGTSTSIASEIAALSSAGYSVGLVPLTAHFLRSNRSLHPEIAKQLRSGAATLFSAEQDVYAKLICFHHPAVFQTYPAVPLSLQCDEAVLVVHHPPVDTEGTAQYDVGRVLDVLDLMIDVPVRWAPVGPKVRKAFDGVRPRPVLLADDWVNVIDPAAYCGARIGPHGALPILGRHSRPEMMKWPDSVQTVLEAYPDAPDIRVRLMGFPPELLYDLEFKPKNWELIPFGAEDSGEFLKTIDYFSHFHSQSWIEAFGRAILEAMASGHVCFLPKDFQPVFGEGAVYCQPDEVAGLVRHFQQTPGAYARQSRQAVDVVKDRYSLEVAIARVRDLIGEPRPVVTPEVGLGHRLPRVLYFTSNGIGMGHLTRVLACGRRHRDRAEPIVVSMSRAFSVARQEGIAAEYIPFFRSSGMDQDEWHVHLRSELINMLGFYRPSVFVLDANVPYRGVTHALDEFPKTHSVWLRRAMWPPDVGQTFIEKSDDYDLVMEPGEIASPFDRGLTREWRDRAKLIAPIRYMAQDEALGRDAARTVLGLDPNRPAVFLQLGSGNNLNTNLLRDRLIHKLMTDVEGGPPQIVVGQWMIGGARSELPEGVIALEAFPFARFLNAFDYAIALAGYNTYHENLNAGLPTLFLSNEHPEQDEQWLRSEYAGIHELALSARTSNIYDVLRAVHELSKPSVQDRLRRNCRRIPSANGADEAAEFLANLACTVKPHIAVR